MALQLNAEIAGDGPPLLVLHGLFGSAANWRSVARALSNTRQVHALDLRNHGSSPWADTMAYAEMAGDVAHYIDQRFAGQQLQHLAVLGHSMGGKTAMVLALTRPELVERLIVVDIAPLGYADTMTPFAQAMGSVDVLAAASRTEVQRRLQPLLPDPTVAPFLLQNLVSRNDHFDWRINLAAISASIGELSHFPAPAPGWRFDRPVTVISGERSDYVAPAAAAAYAALFPQVAFEVIAGAGHWVHADQPQAFIAAVRRALAADAAAR